MKILYLNISDTFLKKKYKLLLENSNNKKIKNKNSVFFKKNVLNFFFFNKSNNFNYFYNYYNKKDFNFFIKNEKYYEYNKYKNTYDCENKGIFESTFSKNIINREFSWFFLKKLIKINILESNRYPQVINFLENSSKQFLKNTKNSIHNLLFKNFEKLFYFGDSLTKNKNWGIRKLDKFNKIRGYFTNFYFEKYNTKKNSKYFFNHIFDTYLINNIYKKKSNIFINNTDYLVEDSEFIINTKLKVFLQKIKYTKYYDIFSLEFLDLEKKLDRVRKKRKNNREMRRWFSKFARYEILYSIKKVDKKKTISDRFLADTSYLSGSFNKIFKNHINSIRLNFTNRSDFWFIYNNFGHFSFSTDSFLNNILNGFTENNIFLNKYPIYKKINNTNLLNKLINYSYINYSLNCKKSKLINSFGFVKIFLDNLEFRNTLISEVSDLRDRSDIFNEYRENSFYFDEVNNNVLEFDKVSDFFLSYIINKKNKKKK